MSTTTRRLLEKRSAVAAEMRALVDAAGDANFSDEQRARFDALKGEADALQARIDRQATVDALDLAAGNGVPLGEQRSAAPTVRVGGAEVAQPAGFDGSVLLTQGGQRVPVLEKRHRLADFVPEQRGAEMGFGQFLRALYMGPANEIERRALGEASVGAGGAMVPATLAAQVIDLLRAKSVAFQAGARTVPMDSATLKFARITGDPTGGWRNEAASITESDPAFDNVTLTARSWALLTKVSRELLEDGQNTDAVLRSVFAASAALALDRAILFGSGIAPEPKGIVNHSGIQAVSMGTNGGQLSGYGKLLDAIQALETANAGTVSAMVMHPRTARAVNGLTDTTGQPLLVPPRIANIPTLTTTAASVAETQGTANNASSIVLGDFSEVYVGMRTSLQVSVLNERYADTGQVGFVSWLRADVLVTRPAALARITGITP